MKNQIIAGGIVGAAIIVATGMWIYFSPYQTCVRAFTATFIEADKNISPDFARNAAQRRCAISK